MDSELIRPAVEADILRIIDMIERLVVAVDGPQKPCRIKTGETLAGLIHSPDGAVFVSDGGFIAGCIGPTIISPIPICWELGWWAEDKSGLRLLRALEEWAAAKGATMVKMSCAGGAAQRVLEKSGYRVAEIQMIRGV